MAKRRPHNYIGILKGKLFGRPLYEPFTSARKPTRESVGDKYKMVVGPFRSTEEMEASVKRMGAKRKNPGAEWHADERDRSRKLKEYNLRLGMKSEADLYLGKESAHNESILKSKQLGLNPPYKCSYEGLVEFEKCSSGVKWRTTRNDKTYYLCDVHKEYWGRTWPEKVRPILTCVNPGSLVSDLRHIQRGQVTECECECRPCLQGRCERCSKVRCSDEGCICTGGASENPFFRAGKSRATGVGECSHCTGKILSRRTAYRIHDPNKQLSLYFCSKECQELYLKKVEGMTENPETNRNKNAYGCTCDCSACLSDDCQTCSCKTCHSEGCLCRKPGGLGRNPGASWHKDREESYLDQAGDAVDAADKYMSTGNNMAALAAIEGAEHDLIRGMTEGESYEASKGMGVNPKCRTYEDVADAVGLEEPQRWKFLVYMADRFGDREKLHCQVGYAAEWARRFNGRWEWEDSDLVGRSLLQKMAPTEYPSDIHGYMKRNSPKTAKVSNDESKIRSFYQRLKRKGRRRPLKFRAGKGKLNG